MEIVNKVFEFVGERLLAVGHHISLMILSVSLVWCVIDSTNISQFVLTLVCNLYWWRMAYRLWFLTKQHERLNQGSPLYWGELHAYLEKMKPIFIERCQTNPFVYLPFIIVTAMHSLLGALWMVMAVICILFTEYLHHKLITQSHKG